MNNIFVCIWNKYSFRLTRYKTKSQVKVTKAFISFFIRQRLCIIILINHKLGHRKTKQIHSDESDSDNDADDEDDTENDDSSDDDGYVCDGNEDDDDSEDDGYVCDGYENVRNKMLRSGDPTTVKGRVVKKAKTV